MNTFCVKHIKERYGVSEGTVLGWIHSGVLPAFDISRVGSSRPKWRITPEALEAFELSRQATSPVPRKKKKRTQKPGQRQRMFYI